MTEGRRGEFRAFPEFAAPDATARLPNPQAESTFESSRLRWDEAQAPDHFDCRPPETFTGIEPSRHGAPDSKKSTAPPSSHSTRLS